MQHITSDATSLLAGDEVADLLIRYAALVGQQRSADSVRIRAIEPTGATTTVTFLLNAAMRLTLESVETTIAPPDNAEAEQDLRARIVAIETHRRPAWDDIAGTAIWNRVA